MNERTTVTQEAASIISDLYASFPQNIDGREAITAMKNNGSKNWKQMEWMGFYFEEKARHSLDVDRGPTIDGTRFDVQKEYVWDLKTHSRYRQSGNKRYEMYLNDAYSMEQCIDDGGMGFIVAYVEPEYDNDERDFYHWHQELKGGDSKYTKNRKKRGASSRRRKTAFEFDAIEAYWIDTLEELKRAIDEGWISRRGQGRNHSGDARNDKYLMKPHNVPDSQIAASIEY
jgi:hypothetical protein